MRNVTNLFALLTAHHRKLREQYLLAQTRREHATSEGTYPEHFPTTTKNKATGMPRYTLLSKPVTDSGVALFTTHHNILGSITLNNARIHAPAPLVAWN
ncbi:MAG: hypothetical protein Q8L87_17770 [Anaerolineales bacterium]|nr:hypothetical protein [Anaerolineales bacterium]